MRRTLLLLILFILCTSALTADFSLSWQRDIPIAAAGATVFIVSRIMLHNDPPPDTPASRDDIFAPDRALMRAYNETLAKVSDVTEFACLGLPLTYLADFDGRRLGTAVVMYAEAGLLAFGLKDLGKALTSRYRPYTYFDGAPTDEGSDDWHSFPSGHTTLSFTGSAFTAALFHVWYSDNDWKWPVTLGAASLAVVTGSLRIACGEHFLTDVLAGALLGTACGVLVPLLHLDGVEETTETEDPRSLPPVTLGIRVRK